MAAATALAQPRNGIAMHGEPALAEGFLALPYTNPTAPRGGAVVFAQAGSFDSLNPLIVKGNAAAGVREYVYESLLARNLDEPFSLYGLIAQTVDVAEDRSSAVFALRPEARFSDGHPVSAADVIFSHQLLMQRGRPNLRASYAKAKPEALGTHSVRFTFTGGDREMPLIIGLMPILPAHVTDPAHFEETSFAPPLGSGPYVVAEVKPGSSIAFRRNEKWWGAGLPINRGLYNFDTMRFDYYRDDNAAHEAFKRGLISYVIETDPTRWATGYDFPALREGRAFRREVSLAVPAGMSGIVMNTRSGPLADIRVRQALTLLFDGEWIARTLYGGLLARTASYFARSELASVAAAPSQMPQRDRRREALRLLAEAGYAPAGGRIAKQATPLRFEFLAANREQQRRALAFKALFDEVGIALGVRLVDAAQYQRQRTAFEFDMIEAFWPASLSPGNEQNFRWSSAAAKAEGSFNFAGVSDAEVDAAIARLLRETTREGFVAAAQALDARLLAGAYVIPLFHPPRQWIAWHAPLTAPERFPLVGSRPEAWWMAPMP